MLSYSKAKDAGLTKYATTEYNRFRKAQAAIDNAFSSARAYKINADLADAQALKVRETYYSKLTPYYRGKFDGYVEALRAQVWREVRWQLYLDDCRVSSDEIVAIADTEEKSGKDRLDTWKRVQGRFEWPGGLPYTQLAPTWQS